MLWSQQPLLEMSEQMLSGQSKIGCIRPVEGYVFAPLVQERMNLIADIHVTFLRPEEPGSILTQGGDIDNRLKTLFDALRMPKRKNEMPESFKEEDADNPFFCLLEDDNLISALHVTTDRLLEPVSSKSEVIIILHIRTKVTRASLENIGLGM